MLEAFFIFMPLLFAIIASLVAWRRHTQHINLFFITSCLTMLGLQGMVAPTSFSLLLPIQGSVTVIDKAVSHSLMLATALQVIIGFPFLWWLSNAFRKT